MFGGNFSPRGWSFGDGQLLAISQYNALFSLLGTTYGGDGRTTFGLPDLRGRVAVHQGSGPGLPVVSLGQKAGEATVTRNAAQMPEHNHTGVVHAVNPPPRAGVEPDPINAYNAQCGVYATEPNAKMAVYSVVVGKAVVVCPTIMCSLIKQLIASLL